MQQRLNDSTAALFQTHEHAVHSRNQRYSSTSRVVLAWMELIGPWERWTRQCHLSHLCIEVSRGGVEKQLGQLEGSGWLSREGAAGLSPEGLLKCPETKPSAAEAANTEKI